MRPRLLHRQCGPAGRFSAATLAGEGSCSAWGGGATKPGARLLAPGTGSGAAGGNPRGGPCLCPAQAEFCPQSCPALGTCSGPEEDLWGWRMPPQTARLLEGGPLRRGPLAPGKEPETGAWDFPSQSWAQTGVIPYHISLLQGLMLGAELTSFPGLPLGVRIYNPTPPAAWPGRVTPQWRRRPCPAPCSWAGGRRVGAGQALLCGSGTRRLPPSSGRSRQGLRSGSRVVSGLCNLPQPRGGLSLPPTEC